LGAGFSIMSHYIVNRLLLAVPTILGATVIIFLIMRVIPGDVVDTITGESGTVSEARREELRKELGLKDNLAVQYGKWIRDLVVLDPGDSIVSGQPIIDQVRPRLLVTAELAIGAILVSVLIAIPIGIISAIKQDTWIDYVMRVVSIGGLSLPSFWLATLVILMLSRYFNWLPPLEYHDIWEDPSSNLQQMVWPIVIVGYALSASVSRMTRSSILEVLREDYVRTARAKGLNSFTVSIRHVLRNALLPVVTISAAQLGNLIAGSVVMETIFVLPGIGSYTVNAITQRDYPAVQFSVTLMALVFVVINLLTDLSYGLLDPRIRYD
jgi:peptide/nickel transport system permease protein